MKNNEEKCCEICFDIFLTGVLVCAITACGAKTADESRIKQELESNQQFHVLQDGETIDEVVIEKRQTDKEQKTDKVWCSVSTNDTEAAYQKNVVLTHRYLSRLPPAARPLQKIFPYDKEK